MLVYCSTRMCNLEKTYMWYVADQTPILDGSISNHAHPVGFCKAPALNQPLSTEINVYVWSSTRLLKNDLDIHISWLINHQPTTMPHLFWGGDHPWKWSIIYHHLSPSIVETLLNLVNYTNLAIENRIQIPCWMLNFHQPNQDSHEFSINYVPVFLVNHGFTYGSTYSFPHLGQCQASQGATHRCRRTNGDDQQRMPQGQLRHPPLHALQQLGPAIAVEEDLVATLGTWGPTWMSGEFWGL